MRDKTTGLITAAVAAIKLLKYAKFALVPISLVGSLVTYGLTLGWTFGIILISVLFVHEMGHVVAARRVGVKVSAPYFIPFMGAVILADRADLKGEKHSIMAAGGPLFGTLLAAMCLAIYWLTGSDFKPMLVAAAIGAIINLFNMLPVRPLDGGRFFDTALPRFGGAVACALIAAGAALGDPILCFIAMIMIVENFTSPWRARVMVVAVVVSVAATILSYPWWLSLIVLPIYSVLVWAIYTTQERYEERHGKPEVGKVSRKWLAIWFVMTVVLIVLTALSLAGVPSQN